MPTYEYVCAKCGHEFEKYQPIAAKALTQCPADLCAKKKWGRGAVKRKIGLGGGLLFKGSGFYITDYRSEGYKSAAKKDSEASKPAAASSESKPATTTTKAESKPAKPAAKKD
ncbi:MAG: zinc ribbon domain-containing protein [Pedosphaera sp.]|nr:zinc ribbon domain-containing protein [Pedosphaera sp.]